MFAQEAWQKYGLPPFLCVAQIQQALLFKEQVTYNHDQKETSSREGKGETLLYLENHLIYHLETLEFIR